jgi:hypothetical protein
VYVRGRCENLKHLVLVWFSNIVSSLHNPKIFSPHTPTPPTLALLELGLGLGRRSELQVDLLHHHEDHRPQQPREEHCARHTGGGEPCERWSCAAGAALARGRAEAGGVYRIWDGRSLALPRRRRSCRAAGGGGVRAGSGQAQGGEARRTQRREGARSRRASCRRWRARQPRRAPSGHPLPGTD